MVKMTLKFFMFSLCFCSLTGCVSSEKYQNIPDGAALKIPIPERVLIDEESVPAETKMVCAAIINALRHREETPFVRFFSAGREKIVKEEFNYEGFDVIAIDFTDLQNKQIGKDQSEGAVEGVFHFQDFVGRRVSLYFMAEYMASPYGIAINNAGVVQLPPFFPMVEAFFVPFEAFNTGLAHKSYGDLYAFALKNGLDTEPSEAEKKSFYAYQKLSYWEKRDVPPQKKQKLVVMVFCKDRLIDSARFEVAASQGNIKPGYLDKNGWPIALYAGEFVPDTWEQTFDIMAFYVPQDNVQRLTIGKFTNRKSYGPE